MKIETAADFITSVTFQNPKSPITASNIYDLIHWCRDYERLTKFPVPVLKRFAIGLYQIHQGMDWKNNGSVAFTDTTNKEESYAAAALHFIMVAERVKLTVDSMCEGSLEFKNWPHSSMFFKAESLLRDISKAQQQLFYADPANKTKRRDRYNQVALSEALTNIVYNLTCLIAPENRTYSFHLAMEIMIKLS